jgi:transposase
LDENLEYIDYKIIEDTIYINLKSSKVEMYCPECNTSSQRILSRYQRRFQDLHILGKKTVVILNNRNFFATIKIVIKRPFLRNLTL